MRKIWLFAPLTALGMLAVLIAACGDDDDDDTADDSPATADLCTEVEQLSVALQDVDGLTEESTVDEAQAAIAAVGDEIDDLRPAAQDVAEERVSELDAAYAELDQAISEPEGDATIEAALTAIQDAAGNVGAVRDQLTASLSCEAEGE